MKNRSSISGWTALVLAGSAVGTAACVDRARDAEPEDVGGPTRVVASIFPIASIAAEVGGPPFHVDVLLPPGASAETFEPTPEVVDKLATARLLILVGAGLDAWTEPLIPVAHRTGETLTLTEDLVLEGEGSGQVGSRGTGNPHVWLDPILVKERLLPRIVEAMIRARPDAAAEIRARGEVYADSLGAVDAEIRGALGPLEARTFVSAHPAWAYLARRYGLRELAALESGPGQEPSPRRLAALADTARAHGVHVVFTEPQVATSSANALAAEIGAEVRLLDPLGGAGVPGRESYLALLRYNAREIAAALAGPGGAS